MMVVVEVVMGGVMNDGCDGGFDGWLFIVMVAMDDCYGGGCNWWCDG